MKTAPDKDLMTQTVEIYDALMSGKIKQETARRRAERLLKQHGLPPGHEFIRILRGYIAAQDAMEAHMRGNRKGANAILKKAQAQGVCYGN